MERVVASEQRRVSLGECDMFLFGANRLQPLIYFFGRLRGRPFRELRERVAQRLAAELEYRRIIRTFDVSGDDGPFDLRSIASVKSISAVPSEDLPRRGEVGLFAGIRSVASKRNSPWDARLDYGHRLIARADRILVGRFDLLGHSDLSFGSPIDWQFDPVSGKCAPRIHWSRIPFLNADLLGDHKVIWEINRHQHFFVLGRVYLLTGDERYALCFADHLNSWMNANPPKIGINWASSLEIAYRAISWLWALEFFRDSSALTPALFTRALKFLHIHGRHLERYLSTYFSPNTHLTGEALGLLYLGVLLPESRRADTWRRKGWDILERELPKQVYEDGVYFEQATYYQRYTVDIYLHALLLARSSGITLPDAMHHRIDRAVGHLAALTRSDGTIPIIGDDDGGRLVWLEERAPMDVRSTLATAAVLLNRPEFAAQAGTGREEVFWLLGPEGVRSVEAFQSDLSPRRDSRLFPVGGYAIMNDGQGPRANHAVIDCGPLGAMNCGHAHSDALSIEVAVAGCPILVDPGTFTYTGSKVDRDRFRHSTSHNTVTVDGESASVPNGPFSWAIRTDARSDAWWTGTRTDYFVGSHPGFERLPDPVTHRRTVLYRKGGYWVIVDSILAKGHHESVARFHAALGSTVTHRTSRSAQIETTCATGGARLFLGVAGDVDSLIWSEDWISPSYGSRALAPCASLTSRGAGRRDLITVLVPMAGDEQIDVREVLAEGGRAVLIDRPGMHDLFVIRTSGAVRVEGVETDADTALIRRRAPHAEVESIAVFGSRARLVVGTTMVTSTNGAEAVRDGDDWVVEGEGRVTTRS